MIKLTINSAQQIMKKKTHTHTHIQSCYFSIFEKSMEPFKTKYHCPIQTMMLTAKDETLVELRTDK